jgi:predicted RNase H-like HicB family nuclease
MDSKYTAVIKKENDWWIGWIEEVPGVNCQERTKEELLSSLKETLKEAITVGSGCPHPEPKMTIRDSLVRHGHPVRDVNHTTW